MAKLTIFFNEQFISEHELDREQVSLGRKPDNVIQLDNVSVSGRHARVLTILNDSFLEDLNSTNGTFVNGQSVKKHALQDGDVITIGSHILTYVNETASRGDSSEFEKTMIIRPDTAGMPENAGGDSVERSVDALGKSLAGESDRLSEKSAGSARIRVTNGTNAGKELALKKALTTLGKPGVQVAAITRRPHGYFLLEIESGGGQHPTVNGAEVGSEGVRLDDGAVIEVAGVEMAFVLD